jgi:hypothetical protein
MSELVWSFIVLYFIRDAVHEPESWMERVMEAGRPLGDLSKAKLRSLLTLMRIFRGEYTGARESLESSLGVFLAHGMDFEAAVALKELVWVRYVLDEDARAAITSLEESSRLFDRIGHDWGVALSELQLGSVLTASKDLEKARARFQLSLERSRRIDNWPLIAQALQHLGLLCILQGRDGDAVVLLEEAAGLLRRGRHRTETTSCLDALGAVALARGDAKTAARAVMVAQATRQRLGVMLWPSVEVFVSQIVAGVRDRVDARELDMISAEARDRDLFETLDQTLEALESRRRVTRDKSAISADR